MLLLNVYKMASLSRSHEISIHLMLLLNGQNFFPSIMHGSISIHLMLLLNSITTSPGSVYIYFNTSYVVIKHNPSSKPFHAQYISIHLMLLLN